MYEVKVMPVNELKSPLNVILYVKKGKKTTFFKRFCQKKYLSGQIFSPKFFVQTHTH